MPEIVADPCSPSCSLLLSKSGIQKSQSLVPDLSQPRARDARGRFAKGSSGNPRGRPRGIRNPRRRVPDFVARPLSPQVLSNLLDRKPHLLRPLAVQLLPPPRSIRGGGRQPVATAPRRCCSPRRRPTTMAITDSCAPPTLRIDRSPAATLTRTYQELIIPGSHQSCAAGNTAYAGNRCRFT